MLAADLRAQYLKLLTDPAHLKVIRSVVVDGRAVRGNRRKALGVPSVLCQYTPGGVSVLVSDTRTARAVKKLVAAGLFTFTDRFLMPQCGVDTVLAALYGGWAVGNYLGAASGRLYGGRQVYLEVNDVATRQRWWMSRDVTCTDTTVGWLCRWLADTVPRLPVKRLTAAARALFHGSYNHYLYEHYGRDHLLVTDAVIKRTLDAEWCNVRFGVVASVVLRSNAPPGGWVMYNRGDKTPDVTTLPLEVVLADPAALVDAAAISTLTSV